MKRDSQSLPLCNPVPSVVSGLSRRLEIRKCLSFPSRRDSFNLFRSQGRSCNHRQPDLHHQPAAITIECRNLPAMEAHRPFSNSQPQSHSASQAPARIIQTIKRLEQFSQRILRNPRPRVAHTNDRLRNSRPRLALQFNLDRSSLLRVADRIADHVLDRAMQQRSIPSDLPASVRNLRIHVAMPRLCFKLGILAHADDQARPAEPESAAPTALHPPAAPA